MEAITAAPDIYADGRTMLSIIIPRIILISLTYVNSIHRLINLVLVVEVQANMFVCD